MSAAIYELFRDRETGYLFKAGDYQSLTQTVLTALDDRENWDAMRIAARRYVEEERNWRVSVDRYKAIYAKFNK